MSSSTLIALTPATRKWFGIIDAADGLVRDCDRIERQLREADLLDELADGLAHERSAR